MSPLRQQMIDALRVRGYSPRTRDSYLYAVSKLAAYYHRSPDKLTVEEVAAYLQHLACERELSASSCRQYLHAARFFYLHVLGRADFDVPIPVPKNPHRIPQLLTRAEVARILSACTNPKHQMMLEVCYGCGLRVSELCALRVSDIDGERELLRVTQGKGAKDRAVVLSPTLLEHLRTYWRRERPKEWLFPSGVIPGRAVAPTTPQKVFVRAKREAGVRKLGGIHGLRHAYATHMLERGVPVHQLQHLLGHSSLQSTLRYLHWLPNQPRGGVASASDLLAGLEVGRG
jgi:integrase/recombinase XerD